MHGEGKKVLHTVRANKTVYSPTPPECHQLSSPCRAQFPAATLPWRNANVDSLLAIKCTKIAGTLAPDQQVDRFLLRKAFLTLLAHSIAILH